MHQVSNLISQIKNALRAGKSEVVVPYSNLNKSILKVMKDYSYIEDCKVFKDGNFKFIRVSLEGERYITDVKVISKPGRRVYLNLKSLKRNRNDLGITILSTPKGVMANDDSLKNKAGGEALCRIW